MFSQPIIQDIFPEKLIERLNQMAKNFSNSAWFEQLQSLMLFHSKIISNYWPISDPQLIKTLSGVPDEKVEQTVIQFYSQNSYIKIQQMVANWGKYDFLTQRMPILNSCLNILLSSSNYKDKNNVLIPTLMAQLTGLKESLFLYIPEEERKTIEKNIQEYLKHKKEKVGENAIVLQFLYEKHILLGCDLLELNEIIFNTTFARKDKILELNIEKYNKFRNKILHGDKKFLNYGTEVNMIRAWLEVDFLIKVHNEIHQRSNLNNTNKK